VETRPACRSVTDIVDSERDIFVRLYFEPASVLTRVVVLSDLDVDTASFGMVSSGSNNGIEFEAVMASNIPGVVHTSRNLACFSIRH
jgi:hypothetical protein